ncbi:unnamed protein product [Caretta caretta]
MRLFTSTVTSHHILVLQLRLVNRSFPTSISHPCNLNTSQTNSCVAYLECQNSACLAPASYFPGPSSMG